eukprot:4787539-Alexandrium_andersonii.AAC.1
MTTTHHSCALHTQKTKHDALCSCPGQSAPCPVQYHAPPAITLCHRYGRGSAGCDPHAPL